MQNRPVQRVYPQISRAEVVIVRCSGTRETFGIRYEETVANSNQWNAVWAFAMAAAVARREGYDSNQISGHFDFADDYPGCPFCGGFSMFRCGACGTLACWDGVTQTMTCPNCQHVAGLGGSITEMDTGKRS